MASFDHIIAISKTVEKYVLDNYPEHLKFAPRLIYRGSDEGTFQKTIDHKMPTLIIFLINFQN